MVCNLSNSESRSSEFAPKHRKLGIISQNVLSLISVYRCGHQLLAMSSSILSMHGPTKVVRARVENRATSLQPLVS